MQRKITKAKISKKSYKQFSFQKIAKDNLDGVGQKIFKAKTEQIEVETPAGRIQNGTVGFCSIKNFKNIIIKMADSREQLASCLNQFMEDISDIVYSGRGRIDKFSKDGVLFYFPTNKKIPDGPTRAASASLKMRYRMNKLNRKWNFNFSEAWFISVGITSGSVQIEDIESEEHIITLIKGKTAQIARAIGSTAGTGKVLITDTTYNEAGFKKGFFHMEDPYHMQPGGIDEMTKLHEITGMLKE